MWDEFGELLRVHRRVERSTIVVEATGEVDLSTVGELDRQLLAACALTEPPTPVVVDLRGISFLGGQSLRVLATAHQRCERAGTPLRLVATHSTVLRPMHLVGLSEIIDVSPTLAVALRPGHAVFELTRR
jgi:anti-sigma B factor antagonist